ncbi:NAD-dependent dehydratase [Pedobacter yulinensis]|uniref:NAD-dependent dehydratase n=1 Tax=Pedobacter yulinensis TaxID=2126353 RepID=A0A2T3HN78_9SPHI|nr:NAD(P)H-binding protein [Pedobacter yulinensis]PST83867.1 NAD-dependent dehydratase [Pedobacter yulinensis]
MKIVITGSTGNISKPLARILLGRGHQLTVVSSNPAKKEGIEQTGASAAIGSIADNNFLESVFKGADAVYAMVPPDFSQSDYVSYFREAGDSYAQALQASGVKRIVFLSSIGADLPSGTGPIAGIHQVEQILGGLKDLDITFLRAGFFYTNFLANIDMIKHAGFLGTNYAANTALVLVHPADIAAAAADLLEQPGQGKEIAYISSDERTALEVAKVLGAAIGKPDLQWIQFSDEDALQGMRSAGLPDEIAGKYAEMNRALGSGILLQDYRKQDAKPSGSHKLEDFATEFAAAYNA